MLVCCHLLMNADPGSFPTLFSSYYHVREAGYDLRQNGRLHMRMSRPDIGQNFHKSKVAGLWNNKFNLINRHLHKKNIRATISKHFIETHQ